MKYMNMFGALVNLNGMTVYSMTIACLEGHLPLISHSNSDKVIGSPQVQFSKVLGLAEPLNEFIKEWEQVLIPYCNRIELAIVTAQSELS